MPGDRSDWPDSAIERAFRDVDQDLERIGRAINGLPLAVERLDGEIKRLAQHVEHNRDNIEREQRSREQRRLDAREEARDEAQQQGAQRSRRTIILAAAIGVFAGLLPSILEALIR